jgi:hypothetical protein
MGANRLVPVLSVTCKLKPPGVVGKGTAVAIAFGQSFVPYATAHELTVNRGKPLAPDTFANRIIAVRHRRIPRHGQ